MREKTIISTIILLSSVLLISTSYAAPYGKGIYNSVLPYGSQTALSIMTSGDVTIPVTPTGNGALSTGVSTVTVTSTDVSGYKLYIRSLNDTAMNNQGATIPSSVNISPDSLANNTWGYNTDDSANFVGMALSDTLIRSVSTPTPFGSTTNVTYGLKVDMKKPAGDYSTEVVYTAVPQS